MEESSEEYFPGSDQEGGGEKDDGAADVRRHLPLPQEEKHQDVQRDSGRQVRETDSLVAPMSSGCMCRTNLETREVNIHNKAC